MESKQYRRRIESHILVTVLVKTEIQFSKEMK